MMKVSGELKVIGLVLALLLLSACEQLGGGEAPPTATPAAKDMVTAEATATPRPVYDSGTTILAEGALVAMHPQLPLGFSTNGRLLSLNVQAGDQIDAGELIAALDDSDKQDALVDAGLAVRQAENSLAQAQLSLDNLLNWEPDETAVAQAQASLAAAESTLENAQSQDAASGYSVTAAKVQLEQAEQALVDAQEAYDTAFDPGRDWEQFIDDPSCRTAEQFPNCTGPPYSDVIKAEREAAVNFIPNAEDQLRIARANYNLAIAGLNSNSAVSAEASIASARQALQQALKGPAPEDIAAARLGVEQAQLALEQARLNLAKVEESLADTQLTAPWAGTVLSVDSAPGSFVGAGTAVVTLLDTEALLFQTNNLSERDLAQLSPGLPAVVTLKTYANEPIGGEVVRIAPRAEGSIGDAATFAVLIRLEERDLQLLPGMTGRVEISSDS